MSRGPRLGRAGVVLLVVTSTAACGLTVLGTVGDDTIDGGPFGRDASAAPDASDAGGIVGSDAAEDAADVGDAAVDGGDAGGGDAGGGDAGGGDAGGGDAGRCESGTVRTCTSSHPQCGPGQQTCADGVFGPCVGPIPTEETCNGLDDDCNDTVDDPCPTGVTLGATVANSPRFGEDVGPNPYDDTCPEGEVLIGVSVRMEQFMRTIRGQCGAIAIVEDKSKIPYEYALTVSPGTLMAEHGTVQGTLESAQCPPDTVVVAVSGRAGAWVDEVTLHCAPLSLTTDPGPSFGLTIGGNVTTHSAGGNGGSPVAQFDCPAGTFVNRMHGGTGGFVDSVTFSCATPSITRESP